MYPDGYDVESLFKFGEKIGRVCYRSEDKITLTSYKSFISNMKLSGHGSVLEHIPIYLKVSYLYIADHIETYEYNKYTIIYTRIKTIAAARRMGGKNMTKKFRYAISMILVVCAVAAVIFGCAL